MVKNPPSSVGDVGLISGWGTKIPQATEQQSLCATTTEPVPQLESPLAANYRARVTQLEKSVCHNKGSHMLQLRPNAGKNK